MNVLVFGLGNAGKVLIKSLYYLFLNYLNEELKFIFVTRNSQKVAFYLSKYPEIFKNSIFLEFDNFNLFKEKLADFRNDLGDIDFCINASLPKFNNLIQSIAIELNSHYMDMASDMYNHTTLSNMYLNQILNAEGFKLINRFALINLGISPGLTNFFVARSVKEILRIKDFSVESIDFFLFENFIADRFLLSWSPQVALEEFSEKPKHIVDGELLTYEPFGFSFQYVFPGGNEVLVYPVFQEEIIGLSQVFPSVKTIRIYAGGSEVEFFKSIYQLGLTSLNNLDCPNLNKNFLDNLFAHAYKNVDIDLCLSKANIVTAQFSAITEIKVRYLSNKAFKYKICINFDRYKNLINSSHLYCDSTYIGYVTGISASLLFLFTYLNYLENRSKFVGVLNPEYLSDAFDLKTYNLMLKELSNSLIDYKLIVSDY